jgi:hypothetical protein
MGAVALYRELAIAVNRLVSVNRRSITSIEPLEVR